MSLYLAQFYESCVDNEMIYSISQEICTRFCCALFCCGYAIVHNEFKWSIYPYSSGLLCWHWAIVRLPQCQWSKPDGYGKIRQCITTTKHSKEKTVCIFPGIYCIIHPIIVNISILQLTQGLMITWSYTYFTGCNLHRVTQFFLFLSIIYIYVCVCVL